VQEAVDDVRVRLVVHDGQPPAAEEAEIEAHIRRAMGPRCRVTFEIVDRIAPTAQGKRLYTLSKVTSTPASSDGTHPSLSR